jgi:hypothetical protein
MIGREGQSANKNAPAGMAGAFCSGRRRPRFPACRNRLLPARFPPTGRHPAGVEVTSGVVHIAAQLAAFFGRQALAAAARISVVRRHLLKAPFGGHHPPRLVATGVAAWSQALRYLSRRDCNQQPQSARHHGPSNPALCPHVRSCLIHQRKIL